MNVRVWFALSLLHVFAVSYVLGSDQTCFSCLQSKGWPDWWINSLEFATNLANGDVSAAEQLCSSSLKQYVRSHWQALLNTNHATADTLDVLGLSASYVSHEQSFQSVKYPDAIVSVWLHQRTSLRVFPLKLYFDSTQSVVSGLLSTPLVKLPESQEEFETLLTSMLPNNGSVCADCTRCFSQPGLQCASYSPDFYFQDVSMVTDATDTQPGATIHGTLVLPGAGKPSRAIATITGSGPNDRWGQSAILPSGIESGALFKQVAIAAAKQGAATLAMDKRSVFSQTSPVAWRTKGCNLPSAGGLRNPSCTNIDALKSSGIQSFVADAVNAARTAANLTGVNAAGFVGHSQGCNIAPAAAIQLGREGFIVDRLILLAGTGVPIGQVLSDQLAVKFNEVSDLLSESGREQWQCGISTASKLYENAARAAAGSYDAKESFLVPFGVYAPSSRFASANGVICPGNCGNGLCSQQLNQNCWQQCLGVASALQQNDANNTLAASLVISQLQFAAEWQNISQLSVQVQGASAVHGPVFAINGWTDTNVPPAVYAPLHAAFSSGLPGSWNQMGTSNTTVLFAETKSLKNVTHPMTPLPKGSCSSSSLRSATLNAINKCNTVRPDALGAITSALVFQAQQIVTSPALVEQRARRSFIPSTPHSCSPASPSTTNNIGYVVAIIVLGLMVFVLSAEVYRLNKRFARIPGGYSQNL